MLAAPPGECVPSPEAGVEGNEPGALLRAPRASGPGPCNTPAVRQEILQASLGLRAAPLGLIRARGTTPGGVISRAVRQVAGSGPGVRCFPRIGAEPGNLGQQ
jgi:hypothetical protein